MTAIPTTFGAGGANLTPTGSGTPTLAQTLRDVATDLAGIRTGVVTGMDITSADPTAVSDGAIGAFTDPPSAAEMAALRSLVNQERTTVIEARTLILEIKGDLNANVVGTITSADPPAISAAALGAFTDPPSAAEMALLRTLVNELRTTVIAIRTLDIEIKTDLNAGTAASIPALLTTAA